MCEYCKGWEDEDILYGENAYCDICIGKVFNHPNLILKDIRRGCPQYSDCIGKLNAPKIAFAIRYCPNCGQKLEKQTKYDPEMPCNKKGCDAQTRASCCGCPEQLEYERNKKRKG